MGATVVAHGFWDLCLQTISADTLSVNARSIRLLERLGSQQYEVRVGSRYFSLQRPSDTS